MRIISLFVADGLRFSYMDHPALSESNNGTIEFVTDSSGVDRGILFQYFISKYSIFTSRMRSMQDKRNVFKISVLPSVNRCGLAEWVKTFSE